MKRVYRSHKLVRAAQITAVQDVTAGLELTLDDPEEPSYVAPMAMFARYRPRPGDYLVEYADGYRSISPRAAFEGGYTPVED